MTRPVQKYLKAAKNCWC